MPDEFAFSRLAVKNFPLLHYWLNQPHVAERWGGQVSLADVNEKYIVHATSKNIRGYLVALDGTPFGYIQAYDVATIGDGWWPDGRMGEVGVDLFIGEITFMGRGLGFRFLRTFCDEVVFADSEVTKIITDPSPDNPRAIRSYEKAGFLRKGVIDTPDGQSILMERMRSP